MSNGDAGRRRPRRSTAATQRLERMRANQARLDAERRDRQQRENAALERFAEHEVAVTKREQQRDQVVTSYEEKIERERAQAVEDVARVREQQAVLVRELREVGRTPTDIAALVEWPLKQVQRLLRESTSPRAKPVSDREQRKVTGDSGRHTSDGNDSAGDSHVVVSSRVPLHWVR